MKKTLQTHPTKTQVVTDSDINIIISCEYFIHILPSFYVTLRQFTQKNREAKISRQQHVSELYIWPTLYELNPDLLMCLGDMSLILLFFVTHQETRETPDHEKSDGDDFEVVNSKEKGK